MLKAVLPASRYYRDVGNNIANYRDVGNNIAKMSLSDNITKMGVGRKYRAIYHSQ
jgi:hypothetical protein